MDSLTQVSIDFETSHLVFPTLVACVLAGLGASILITKRAEILQAGAYWGNIWRWMDKGRTVGALALTVIYFIMMVPVGDIWPNRGFGFLFCSVPYVMAVGVLFMHDRRLSNLWPMALVALIAPTLIWWLFAEVFYLTLP